MSTQRRSMKQGFTLIELMVVIVIIGILAAIAIPKLFGMTAKAKASEVGPAAGTWSKLQAAYIMESPAGKPGPTFQSIGYTPPGSKENNDPEKYTSGTFKYASDSQNPKDAVPPECDNSDPPKCEGGSPAVADGAIWRATNDVKLNDCQTGNTWEATYETGADKPNPGGTYTDPTCQPLTPNFAQLR